MFTLRKGVTDIWKTGRRMSNSSQNVFSSFRLDNCRLSFPAEPTVESQSAVELVCRYAAFLQQMGISPGDRMAVHIDKSFANVILYLAALKIGSVYVPLNTDYQTSEIEYLIGDSKPKLMVVGKSFSEDSWNRVAKVSGGGTKVLVVDELRSLATSTPPVAESFVASTDADSPAALVYTSGTTGKPKGAMITHRNLLFNSKTLQDYWGFHSDDSLLHTLPLYHVHGLFVALNTALMTGCHMTVLPKFNAKEIIRHLPSSTVLMGIPTYYSRLLSEKLFSKDTIGPQMRLFVSGSAPLTIHCWHEFKKRSGYAILERYGLTECQMVCSNPLLGLRKPGTVGLPLPHVTVRLNERNGLEVKGDNVFKGYWGMPEKTQLEFTADGYFITGDSAQLDSDGYVTIVGREKDMIITGGLNVYPKEVELQLDTIKGVKESAVIGVPHQDYGEAVMGVVVLDQSVDGAHLTADEVIKQLKGRLAHFKVPKYVEFVAELPRNAMGKVQKNILRKSYGRPQ